MLAEQADYAIFAALIALAFGVVAWWLSNRRQLRLPGRLLALCALLLAAGWLPVQRAGEAEAQRVRGMVLGFAPTYADELSRMGHEHIRVPTPPGDPLLLRLIDAQKRWLRVNPAIVSIYTLRQRPDGVLVFIVGAEVDYDGDGVYAGAREQRSVVGEAYAEAGDFWLHGFAGETVFDHAPYTDQWGTWVSAVTPMYDSQGRIEAVLGVDYDASTFLRAVAVARAIVISVIGMLLLSVLSVSVIALLHAEHLRRVSAEEALRREKEVAQASNRAKSDFLSNMSHELRTPLHAIVAFSRLGHEKASAPEVPIDKLVRYFSRILESSERLLSLLNDLLDLSKLEAGRMTYQWQRVDLVSLAQEAVEEYEAYARQKQVQVHLRVHAQAIPAVSADHRALTQVLTNLLSNAIKYAAPDSAVTVILSPVAPGSEPGFPTSPAVLLSVEDRGIGIPADELEEVFDKFVQSSNTKTGAGGTGLGLSIAREIILDHGGRIWASNNPQGGACFHVLLPVPVQRNVNAPEVAAAT